MKKETREVLEWVSNSFQKMSKEDYVDFLSEIIEEIQVIHEAAKEDLADMKAGVADSNNARHAKLLLETVEELRGSLTEEDWEALQKARWIGTIHESLYRRAVPFSKDCFLLRAKTQARGPNHSTRMDEQRGRQ